MGTIKIFAFNFAPRTWALCNGQLMAISQNAALFSLLGTTYGGNGTTNFALPDLRGRSMVGVGQGPGTSLISWGQIAGTENSSLNMNTMPMHIHPLTSAAANLTTTITAHVDSTLSNETDNGGNTFSSGGSTPSVYCEPVTTLSKVGGMVNTITGGPAPVGGNIPFGIRNPYVAMTHCILLSGIFPSRN